MYKKSTHLIDFSYRFQSVLFVILFGLYSGTLLGQDQMSPDLKSVLSNLDTYGGRKFAKRLCNKYISDDPEDKWGWYGLGKVYDSMYERDSAAYCYERAVRIDTAFVAAWYAKANNMTIVDRKRSVAIFDTLQQLAPDYFKAYYYQVNPMAYTVGWREAIELMEYIESRFQDSLSDRSEMFYLDFGDAFYKLDRFDEAIDKYRKVLNYNPRWPTVYLSLGNSFYAMNNKDSAVYYYRKSINIYDPGSYSSSNYYYAFYRVGMNLFEDGKVREAIEHYDQAIAIREAFGLSSGMAYALLAEALIKLQSLGETIEGFTPAQLEAKICEQLENGANLENEWAGKKLLEHCQ